MLFKQLTNSSGGLFYHLSALHNSKNHWHDFKDSLENWLINQWNPLNSNLLLIAPSAGYTLSKKFLNQYQNIYCIDTDPLAQWLFNSRGVPTPSWSQKDYFKITKSNSIIDFTRHLKDGLFQITQEYSHCDLLFCNFLGQIPNLLAELQLNDLDQNKIHTGSWVNEWRQALQKCLKNRHWASYHDLLSTQPKTPHKPVVPSVKYNKNFSDLQDISKAFFKDSQQVKIILNDHLTWGLFPNKKQAHYFSWPLKKNQFHIIEAICNNNKK